MKYKAEKVCHEEMVKMPLVDLKDGSFRICMDYRKLSEIAIRNRCHRIRIHEEEIPKTNFRTRYRYFEFTVMPFGLTKAPTVFMELMSRAWWFYLRMLEALGVQDEECDQDGSRASTTHSQSEGLNMRQRRWIELFSDYDCETKYHTGKANIVVNAWRRKEGVKPRRVQDICRRIKLRLARRCIIRFGKKGELAPRFFAKLSEGNLNLLCIRHESEKTTWPIVVRHESEKTACPIVNFKGHARHPKQAVWWKNRYARREHATDPRNLSDAKNEEVSTFPNWILNVQEVPNTDFPEHYFNFAAYNELPDRLSARNPILTVIKGIGTEKMRKNGNIQRIHSMEGITASYAVINHCWKVKMLMRSYGVTIPQELRHNKFTLKDGMLRQKVSTTARHRTNARRYNERYEDMEKEKRRNRFPLDVLREVDPQNYQVIVNDGSKTTTITCFNDQANRLTRDVNEVVAELTNKDPYTHLPSLKQLEGTTHIFQFHFDAMITSRRPDFILDKVFAYPILAFPPANPIQIPKPSATSEQHQTSPKLLTSTETKQSPTNHRKEELE
uniref:Reverse transcriptase domain-containing protein n=1 Tax=Tanacetum cinerariifolium TaxID=118510 RepID=A0A6L2N805_TANCI|nr:hypothetical protein [Tanacetum cinerariifolium]